MARKTFQADGTFDDSFDSMVNGGFSVSAFGTWGAGTLSFSASNNDGSNFFPIRLERYDDGTFITAATADFLAYANAVGLNRVRITLAGSTAPALDVTVRPRPA